MSDFEEWLRTVCFQQPPDSCRDLARDAWKHQEKRISALEAVAEALCNSDVQRIIEAFSLRDRDWANINNALRAT